MRKGYPLDRVIECKARIAYRNRVNCNTLKQVVLPHVCLPEAVKNLPPKSAFPLLFLLLSAAKPHCFS